MQDIPGLDVVAFSHLPRILKMDWSPEANL